jgi:hypothetical protein
MTKDEVRILVAGLVAARSAQHTASDFDYRHVEIFDAASARVNVRIFYNA